MSLRTATYNGQQLGDYMVPLNDGVLDRAVKLKFSNSVKPMLQSTNPSIRNVGNEFGEVAFVFCKDVEQNATYNTDEKMHDWLGGIISAIRPTIGSEAGASLVITDGVTSNTYANALIEELEVIQNTMGLMKVKAVFTVKVI